MSDAETYGQEAQPEVNEGAEVEFAAPQPEIKEQAEVEIPQPEIKEQAEVEIGDYPVAEPGEISVPSTENDDTKALLLPAPDLDNVSAVPEAGDVPFSFAAPDAAPTFQDEPQESIHDTGLFVPRKSKDPIFFHRQIMHWEDCNPKKFQTLDAEKQEEMLAISDRYVNEFTEDLGENVLFWEHIKNKEVVIDRMYPRVVDMEEETKRIKEAKEKEYTVQELAELNKKTMGNFSYDFAIVFRLIGKPDGDLTDEQEEKFNKRRSDEYLEICKVCAYLDFCGMEQARYLTKTTTKDQRLIVLIGATEARLRKEAERIRFDLLFDMDEMISESRTRNFDLYTNLCLSDDPEDGSANLLSQAFSGIALAGKKMLSKPQLSPLRVFKHTHGHFKDFLAPSYAAKGANELAQYVRRDKLYQKYYDHPCRQHSSFSQLQRLKLTQAILEAECDFGGGDLMLVAYARNKNHPCIGFFPLHDPVTRSVIRYKFEKECCPVMKDVCCCFRPKLNEAENPTCVEKLTPSIKDSVMHWKIRDYYGEAVGMYFAYLTHYTLWLIPAAAMGLVVSIEQLIKLEVDVFLTPIFAVCMILWASMYLESWKRQEAHLRTVWGTFSFKQKETPRPEFEGQLQYSKVTGQVEEQEEPFRSALKLFFSNGVVATFIGLVILVVMGLLQFKAHIYLTEGAGSTTALICPPLLNAISIMILNIIFQKFARRLNDYENHKTDSAHENSLISKTFLFKFVNSYYSLFAIAFWKRTQRSLKYCKMSYLAISTSMQREADNSWTRDFQPAKEPGCTGDYCKYVAPPVMSKTYFNNTIESWPDFKKQSSTVISMSRECIETINDINRTWDYRGDCLMELMIQLCMVFVTPLIIQNSLEMGIPYLKALLEKNKHQKEEKEMQESGIDEKKSLSVPEKEIRMPQYPGTFADYDELVVQFGFVVLFVVAFPFVPCLALISCIFEFKVDGIKLGRLTRRPYPKAAYDIGNWYSVLGVVSSIAIMTNAYIVVINPSNTFPNFKNGERYLDAYDRLIIFSALEHIMFFSKFIIDRLVPDMPGSVKEHLARQEYITDVLILGEVPKVESDANGDAKEEKADNTISTDP